MKKLKKQQGITLIVLIVTIVVLLILAGVAISMTIGENGVLTQTTTAVKKNKKAGVLEDVTLAWTGLKADYYAKWVQNSSIKFENIVSVGLLQRYLEGKGTVEKIEHEKGSEIYTVNYIANDKEKSTYIIELREDGTAEFSEGISIPPALTLVIENTGEGQNKVSENISASLSNLEGKISWSIIEGASNISLSGISGKEITVTPEAEGSAKIQASCEGYSTICNVTIKEEKPIQSISIESSKTTINVDEALNITANVTPADTTENEFTWISTNPSVASVSTSTTNETTVVGLTPGNTIIRVSNKSGTKTDEKAITVVRPVTGITIKKVENENEIELNANETITMEPSTSGNTQTKTLKAYVVPLEASNKNITWSIVEGAGVVSLPSTTTVESGTGITVTAGTNTGSARLRATTTAGSYTKDIVVSVVQKPLSVGDIVEYKPAGTYEWNKEYASSDETGNITLSSGAGGGSYRITSWKVLRIDESAGTVELVPVVPTGGSVRLQGPQGYNNAVKLLNDACNELYGGTITKGGTEYTITARSINIEDIERTLTETAIEERNNYTNANANDSTESVKYNGTHIIAYSSSRNSSGYYTTNKKYPVMYEREAGSDISVAVTVGSGKESGLGLSSQTQLIERNEGTIASPYQGAKTASTGIRPKQTYYKLGTNYSTFSTKFKEYESGKTYASLLLPSGSSTNYWVASRCTNLYGGYCGFGVHHVVRSRIGG